jgi:hypothetical protein
MKRALFLALALSGSPVLAQTVPMVRYDSVPNLLRLPQNMYLGEVAGV